METIHKEKAMNGWIGVDLDGTLAVYDGWQGAHNIGAPVAPMVDRVKQWVAEGKNVRIMTARVYSDGSAERNSDAETSRDRIAEWCLEHLGFRLPVTCTKDYGMIELWDDRCIQIIPNTGNRADGQP
jgi:hypothetical protein